MMKNNLGEVGNPTVRLQIIAANQNGNKIIMGQDSFLSCSWRRPTATTTWIGFRLSRQKILSRWFDFDMNRKSELVRGLKDQ